MKMNVWDRFVSFFSPTQEFKRARFRLAAEMFRKYEGAASGRRTKNWKAPGTSASAEIQGSLDVLRNRSRQLVRDNPYATKGIQAITANVVGWGIVGQIKVDAAQKNSSGVNKLSQQRTDELTNVWNSWADSKACDYDGRNTLYGLQRLIMRGVAESGEILIRKRNVSRRTVIGKDGFPTEVPPVALQVLESDFLSTQMNWSTIEAGNFIVDGIEFDQNGNRVAYHLFEEHPGNSFSIISGTAFKNGFKVNRVPASEVIHVYRLDRPGQVRGVPWLAPVMMRLRDFDEYEDAQLVRQKIAAMFAVFVKDLDGVDSLLAQNATGDSSLGEKVEPGIIEILPPGKDISLAQPPIVQGYGEYSSNVLHAIAAGLGVTYEALTGDMSQVNFSSARMGFLEMNRNIEEWREDIMLAQFLNPTFDWFRQGAEIIGVDTTRSRAIWSAPRREMIDPVKEVAAAKDAIRSGLMTQSEAIRMAGNDPQRFFEEMAQDNKTLDKLGLILDSDPRTDPKRLLALAGGNPSGQAPPAQNGG